MHEFGIWYFWNSMFINAFNRGGFHIIATAVVAGDICFNGSCMFLLLQCFIIRILIYNVVVLRCLIINCPIIFKWAVIIPYPKKK